MSHMSFTLVASGILATAALTAELVITSFNSNGELTWTNSASSNATYRVEWAGSASGPWNKFDALTNLTLLSATNSSVTVKVPTFYRVVWLDAPAYAGTYNYSGYDDQGGLVVTGRLYLFAQEDSAHDLGTWNFQRAGSSTNNIGPQIGSGFLDGSISDATNLFLNLNPNVFDNNVYLNGTLSSNTLSGIWYWEGIAGTRATGTFSAVKQGIGE